MKAQIRRVIAPLSPERDSDQVLSLARNEVARARKSSRTMRPRSGVVTSGAASNTCSKLSSTNKGAISHAARRRRNRARQVRQRALGDGRATNPGSRTGITNDTARSSRAATRGNQRPGGSSPDSGPGERDQPCGVISSHRPVVPQHRGDRTVRARATRRGNSSTPVC